MLRNRTLLAVSLAVCAAFTGIGMVVPVRVLYAESRGASLAIIGAMASSYLISNFLFQYPSGWLADRWGRKPMMMLSLFFQAALSAVYLLISDPLMFVFLRFAEGAAAAAFLPSARALINDAIPAKNRGEAFGIFSAFFNTGFLLGPALGGLLASTGYASAFIGAVLFRLVAIVIVATMIRVKVQVSQEAQEEVKPLSLRTLFRLPLLGAYVLGFGDYLFIGFDITLTALWLHDHLGASVAVIGLAYAAFSIPSIITSPFGGRVADRRRRSSMILLFGLAQVPIYMIYGLANTVLVVIVFFAIHGVVYSFMQPAVDAHVASSTIPGARARIQGLYSAAGLIGGFVGASGCSFLYSLNFRLPLFAIGVAFGICVIAGGILIRISEARNPNLPGLDKSKARQLGEQGLFTPVSE
ncbi:MAG TPA: MFS transporter [Ktedonobacteraceae bacterium]|nr:MFS transporter [Ktedonobacteraceae bacterium]